MLGLALDPGFAENRTLYIYMSTEQDGTRSNRVLRMTVDPGYTRIDTRRDIVTDIPLKAEANSWGSPGTHSGGRMKFGPDGFLYVGTGDNHNGTIPQDLRSLGGKVLRIDGAGNAAPGNDAPEGADPRIFTFGHRNVQGICFHPRTGRAFVAEHGPNHSDEVTLLTAGGNGGWDPKPEPGVTCADNYCGYISNKPDGRLTPMTDAEKFPDAMRPFFVLEDSEGLGPCAFVVGEEWGDWNEALMIGTLSGERLLVLQLNADEGVARTSVPTLPSERIRSLVQGPDRNLYVVTDGGFVWRLTPRGGEVTAD